MEMVRFVNYSQPPLNDSEVTKTVFETCSHMPEILLFYLSMQITNTILGVPANLMVLWLIHHNRKDSSTSDIFIFHLAVLDTFFCLVLPLELANLVYLSNNKIWYVLRFFYGVKDSSVFFLSCICLDRYLAVLHPIIFSNMKDRYHRPVCAGIMWVITLSYATAKCVGTIPSFDKVFTVMVLAAFIFMLFCNISILWTLKKSGPGQDEMHPVKKRAFKMVLIILGIIVFNYLPPVALFPFVTYFSPDVFTCYISFFAFGFMDISSSIQPVLFLSKVKSKCLACCCTSDQTENANTTINSCTLQNTNK